MLNVAARLVFRLRRYDPITNALDVHWLRLPERVDFKVAVMAFRVLHGLAPSYLDQLVHVADLPDRHRLRLSTSQLLHVPAYRLTIVGRRSILVVASVIWNSLTAVQSLATLSVFFANV